MRYKYTLAISCSVGTALAECALLKGVGSVHSPSHVTYDRNYSHWTKLPFKPARRTANKPRFVSFKDGSNAEVPSVEAGEGAPQPIDGTIAAGNAWMDSPPPQYTYPVEDYLVIPDTRRYCEGSNILLATAAKSVGKRKSCLQPRWCQEMFCAPPVRVQRLSRC